MKQYVVVGGSYGIGQSIVQQLIEEGHQVSVLSRTTGDRQSHEAIQRITYDVLIDDLPMDQLPDPIDGFVYCPGSIQLKPFKSLKLEQFRADLEINLLGAIKCLQALYPRLRASSSSPSVVLFSTIAAQMGMPFHSSIAASKGAVESLAKSLAAEWSPTIRVNVIAPSLTDTPLAAALLSNENKREINAQRHPLKRVGLPTDMAELACFLLSEKSNWMTGQVLGLDGGLSTLKTS